MDKLILLATILADTVNVFLKSNKPKDRGQMLIALRNYQKAQLEIIKAKSVSSEAQVLQKKVPVMTKPKEKDTPLLEVENVEKLTIEKKEDDETELSE